MWVYTIAFRQGDDPASARFVMVRSTKRGGWEMPGGRVEEGEDPETAARREFREETGMDVSFLDGGRADHLGGIVFYGTFAGSPDTSVRSAEIAGIGTFRELPDDLAFPFVEYQPMIEKGRGMLKVVRPP